MGIDIYGGRAPRRRTWAPLTLPLAWCIIFAGVWTSSRIAGLIGLNVSTGTGRWQDNMAALFASGPVLVLLWLWLRGFEGRSLDGIGLSERWQPFGRGFVTGLLLVVAVVILGIVTGAYELQGPGAWFGHLTPTWLLAFVLTVAGTCLQATATEAVFRGWMLETAARQWGGMVALVVTVAACVFIQGGNPLRSPQALVEGINIALMATVLSRNAVRTGSLWGACGLHAAWNLAMGLGFGLNVDGGHLNVTPMLAGIAPGYGAPWWLSGGDFGPDGSILMTVAAAALLIGWPRGKGKPKRRAARVREDDGRDEIIDH